jgi:hypothetical protein
LLKRTVCGAAAACTGTLLPRFQLSRAFGASPCGGKERWQKGLHYVDIGGAQVLTWS